MTNLAEIEGPSRSVSESALLRRLSRKLAKAGQRIRKTRGAGWPRVNFGDFRRIDIECNGLLETHVDLERLARELGVLSTIESVKR